MSVNISKFGIRGDTIVEVLIAISVVSLVLAGAYTSTRRSANATRTAQEQGEALKYAETQVELIKWAVDNNFKDDWNSDGVMDDIYARDNFCLRGNVSALSCSTGLYTIEVRHVSGARDFEVHVTWPGLSGNNNSVELDYKAQL